MTTPATATPASLVEAAPATISDLLARRALDHPDHVVVTLRDRHLTFGELDETANRAANLLAAVGTGVGERCAVMLPNGQPFLAAWLGAQRVGAIDVGLNVGLKGDLLVHQLATCSASPGGAAPWS